MNKIINSYSTTYLIIQLYLLSFLSHLYLFIHKSHQFFVVVNMERLYLFVLTSMEAQFSVVVCMASYLYLWVLVNKEYLFSVNKEHLFVVNQFSVIVGKELQSFVIMEPQFFV